MKLRPKSSCALRPASSLSLDTAEPLVSASILSAPIALETLAGILRSDHLAWRVITGLKLYQATGFQGSFAHRFPAFRPWLSRPHRASLAARPLLPPPRR